MATTADLPQLHSFLHGLGLPVAGLDEHLTHSVVLDGEGGPHALAALEVHGTVGLLRSVAVAPEHRGQGLAQHLVEGVIERARALGLTDLYLLTTTAAAYFPRFEFQPVPRDTAPAVLHASREFQGVCPASATLMHLALSPRSVAMTQTIPGLTEQTTTAALTSALRVLPQRPLEFHLHGDVLVPAGYHVTELKAVTVEAIDCGGKAAAWRETVLQLMDGSPAEAQGGFMTNRKFLAIYDRGVKHVPVRDEAEVRFEYGNANTPAMQYHVAHVETQPERIIVHLRTPGVQCKALDACGPSVTGASDDGAPTVGCCGPQHPVSLS